MRFVWLALTLLLAACASLPPAGAERALYLDLRKIVETSEDGGWTIDSSRLHAAAEPALRSVCQVAPDARARLREWLGQQIALAGGPAQTAYFAHGKRIGAVSTALSLERTRALLDYADARTVSDCPFWLAPDATFAGEQGDDDRFVLLGETQAFGTIAFPSHVPALGGGGRVFLGHGVGSQLTLALGVDAAASGTFIPSRGGGQGVDAYLTLATPLLLRVTRFSHLFDVELAPVVRLAHGQSAWPPGARIQLGGGFSSVRTSPLMPYFMFYLGYEVHTNAGVVDHTLQLGTRLSIDLAL